MHRRRFGGHRLHELGVGVEAAVIHSEEHADIALGGDRLEALFIGPDITADEADQLVGDIGELDPNVPIVMTNTGDAP